MFIYLKKIIEIKLNFNIEYFFQIVKIKIN
jgi:hypothetical protein